MPPSASPSTSTLTVARLRAHRDHVVPARPVRELTAVTPVLVVDPDANVVPMTHELPLAFWLDRSPPPISRRWRATG